MTSPIDLNSVDPQVLADYKEVFSTFDRDGDGTIDATELGAVMASFGVNPSQAELAKMIEDVDLDKSGAIDFQEFVTMMQSRSNTSNPEDEAESVFYVLDKDKDGMITFDELSAAVASVGWGNEPKPNEADVRNMLKVRGASGNGINLETFKSIVLSK